MKTPLDVINAFYALIPTAIRPVYKFKYPDGLDSDAFIVVNTLGVPKDSIQTIPVNVNCYARDVDISKGVADISTLDTMTHVVINALHNYNNDCFDIEFMFSNIYREEAIKSHYMNLRFELTYINN